ncbi:MAG: GNAT family N-acetyltransferase [Ktedonobacteraceae bacterium]
MHALEGADKRYKRDLGNGLVLRWSTERDAEEIIYLTSTVFRWGAAAPANVHLANMMQEIMHGKFPVTGAGDVAVVEDTRRREHPLVASTCLWRQSWSYAGLPFTIGRPEIVATDAEYRNRGLVRALFALIHARSEAEGHMVQAITGIPYFYRQFGYEYALDLDANRSVPLALVPPAVEGKPEPWTFRDATMEDMPLLRTWYERQLAIYPLSTPFDEQWWQYQVRTMPTTQADGHWRIIVIIDSAGKPSGYVSTNNVRWRTTFPVLDLGTAPGVNLQTLLPSLLRELAQRGATMPSSAHAQALKSITFALGRKHPVYAVLGKTLAIEQGLPYAWYVRVPNLPAFLRYVAPVLEQRLASSALVGYSGALKLNFYRGGLHLAIEQGKITIIEDWQSPSWDSPENAGFPPLVFLQLLFGHRSLDELRFAFPDVWANDEVVPLLNALFPASPSWVLPLG